MKLCQPKCGKFLKGQVAFTLVETMVAVCVIMVVFVTIFGTMTFGLSVAQASRENLRATQIMLDKMEGVRLYNWNQLTNSSFLTSSFTNWFFETNSIGNAAATGNGVIYTGSVAVSIPTNMPSMYSNAMRLVTVTVGWNSGNWMHGTSTHTRTMSTFVSQNGMQNYVFYQ